TPYPRQPVGERIRVQAAEVIAGGEFAEDALGLGHDERWTTMRNARAAGVGVGVADVAAPDMQVVRQVPVDGLQVGEVVSAGDRVLGEFDHAPMDRSRLYGFPSVVVGDAELVDQNEAVRVAVAVGHWCSCPGGLLLEEAVKRRIDRLAHRLIPGQLPAHLTAGNLSIRIRDDHTGRDLPGVDLREHAPDIGLGYRSLESHAGCLLVVGVLRSVCVAPPTFTGKPDTGMPIRHRQWERQDSPLSPTASAKRARNFSRGITMRRPSFTCGMVSSLMLVVIVRGSMPSASAASLRVMTRLRRPRRSSMSRVLCRMSHHPFVSAPRNMVHPTVENRTCAVKH